ncbi:RNA polymerase sigma factor RpoE [Candidatus Berkiella cookevillensis]|nr:RNA polymerase sigma factor RpoE [Candidatus Berkiella cookevillensis]MCS5708274.1 RNA polymerase sigma factor RpoE [Candidatus Berkiella cookevillensis]
MRNRDTLEKELIESAQNGDRQAFDLLVERYQFKIIKLVNRYVRDPVEAMDIAQESFIKAYRAIGKFRGDSAFYTWLYRIAINTAKNHVMNVSRKIIETDVELLDLEQTLTKANFRDYTAPENVLQDNEIRAVIFDVIQKLPKELRTAIMLRELEGLSYEEIATIMTCPIGTVRSRIFRAREAIEKKVKPYLREG